MPSQIFASPFAKWIVLAAACGGVLLTTSAPLAVAPIPEATITELAVERYQVAAKGYELATAGRAPGEAPGADALDWMRRRVKARLDVVEPKNDRVAFLKEYLELLKQEEAFQERLVRKHLGGVEPLLRAQYDRIEAEMMVKQAEAK